MTDSPKPPSGGRRHVSYGSFEEVLQDAESLMKHPHMTLGNWSFGKILQHLADAVDSSFDGFGFRMNLLIRIFGTLFLKNRIIERSFPVGLKLPKRAESLLPPDDVDVAEGFANLKRALARFDSEDPSAYHPTFGYLSRTEWIRLHLNHCAMHMTFVRPT